MSETGLYSVQYQQIHDWAEMVDQLLIAIKSGSIHSVQASGENIGQLLKDFAQREYSNPATRFMVLLLQDKVGLSTTQLLGMGNALEAAEFDDEVIGFLEKIAQILEHEQFGAMSRMQRWTR